MTSLGDYVVECASMFASSTKTVILSKLNEEQCYELRDFRNCVSEKLGVCKATGIIELVDVFYKPLMKVRPCAKVSGNIII